MVESTTPTTFDKLPSVVALKKHYDEVLSKTHLRDLLNDAVRNDKLKFRFESQWKSADGCWLDFTHTKIDEEGLKLLLDVAKESKLASKIGAMFADEKINNTEKRQVGHFHLRAQDAVSQIDKDVVAVQQKIKAFTEKIRSGETRGLSGKKIKTIVAIGIGGSYLGPEFVYEALRYDETCRQASDGMQIKFLANVDPIDYTRALDGVNVEEALFVIVSKTFTTAETMMNAMTCRQHILDNYPSKFVKQEGGEEAVLGSHLCAVSTNLAATAKFGIKDENVFGFWDWVGGRYSVSSAVGLLPLSLFFGYANMEVFLQGLADVDAGFASSTHDLTKNAAAMMGLIGFYNTYICGIESRAVLPYCQALIRFPAHIQQLDMESNGKGVTRDGVRLDAGIETGPIVLGEPGTNGQHSFYQLMHQGRVIAAEFIGFCKSQTPVDLPEQSVSNHDELMSNFFAQPDALAQGKTIAQLEAAGVPEELRTHKEFKGDRPSFSILFEGSLNAFACGQLLGFYEHRVAVEGFVYDINSFDQWGVELGKALAKDTRAVFTTLKKRRQGQDAELDTSVFNKSTQALLDVYTKNAA
jgi:glucose-6-phosphate isomerase